MILYGGDYNPEQWKENGAVLDEDMRLMQLARVNTVTLGIFSWAELEPEEGAYDFSFFDEMIERMGRSGKKIILATPSGARPRWLAQKYPEVLRTDENGIRRRFGGRHNHCYSSPVYREKVRAINEQLSARYGAHPAVIAWHISNEYSGECYCERCRAAFRAFLKARYKDIGALNAAYWSRFWSHTYNDFSQIDPPGATGESGDLALALDWRRFVTERTVDFMKEEIAAVRRHSSLPVTTNMMPGFYGLDYYRFAEHLDFISWDNYPSWNSPDHLREAANSALWHDFFRSLKGKPHLLMESAPGYVNWKQVNKLHRPGMNRLAALQAVAHGSDSVLYFQIRQPRGGAEQYHAALIGHEGTEERRLFREAAETGRTLERLSEIAGSAAQHAQVAILFDWENMWAYEGMQGFTQKRDYRAAVLSCYLPLWRRAVACDVVHPHADLSRYKLVIAARQYMTDGAAVENLRAYVERGGALLAAGFLGMVNESNLCYTGGFPGGALKEVFGLCKEETDALYPEERVRVSYRSREFHAVRFCELLQTKGAKTMGSYASEFYAGTPCITVNGYRKGRAYYLGCGDDDGALTDALLEEIFEAEGIASALPLPLPEGVTAHKRVQGEREYLFVENYSSETHVLPLDGAYTDMERNENTRTVTVEPLGVRVLTRTV